VAVGVERERIESAIYAELIAGGMDPETASETAWERARDSVEELLADNPCHNDQGEWCDYVSVFNATLPTWCTAGIPDSVEWRAPALMGARCRSEKPDES
jgi:hypothetical protein